MRPRASASSLRGERWPLLRAIGKERGATVSLVGFLAWLKSYLRHLSFGGESQIAMESQGEELIDKDEWTKLAESERDKWEPADESPWLYRRKRERW
jgi:hypothetical protein